MNRFAGIPWVFLMFIALLPFGCSSSEAGQTADMVLFNGKIVTVDDSNSEVRALAVRGDRIVALGSDADIKKFIGKKTRVIDLEGRLAIPGFNEGHGHFMGIGNAKMILDLTKAKNWDEIVAMVADAAGKYLDNPESLTVTVAPAAPLPFPQIMGAAMGAPNTIPDVLGVKVEANTACTTSC